jgi:hypothetical protein
MLCLRGINTDQTDILAIGEEKGVSVNDMLHFVSLCIWRRKRRGEDQ